MTPLQAIDILEKITQTVNGDRQTHLTILKALEVLKGLANSQEEEV